MVYYIGTVLVFYIQINWNVIYMAIAVLVATHSLRPLLTIYQQHISFKVLIYVGVLLIQIRFICVLTCFIVKLIRWLNLTRKTHTFIANGRLWENLYTAVSLLLYSIYQ